MKSFLLDVFFYACGAWVGLAAWWVAEWTLSRIRARRADLAVWDSTPEQVAELGEILKAKAPANVHIARSPLAGPRHASSEYAALTPGYEAKHRDIGIRTPASSPIVWADTAIMPAIPDGPFTEEFRGITGLDPAVPVLRTRTLRPEGNPQASWAQQALDLADMEA